jgi:hypothetical protein
LTDPVIGKSYPLTADFAMIADEQQQLASAISN